MGLVSRAVDALRQVEGWPAETVAVAVLRGGEELAAHGPREQVFRWASVTKPVTALADARRRRGGDRRPRRAGGPARLDGAAPAGARSGLPFEGRTPIAAPGERRIYSNTGFEVLAELVGDGRGDAVRGVPACGGARAARDGRGAAGLAGLRPARAASTTCCASAAELQRPRLVAPETLAEATSVQFPGLVGVLPDIGRMEPNDWGLGFELRDAKRPHWTGAHELAAHVRPLRRQRHASSGSTRRPTSRSPA